jgi:hypothetical protein
MVDSPKSDIREWLVPPVLLPLFIIVLVGISMILHWDAIFN